MCCGATIARLCIAGFALVDCQVLPRFYNVLCHERVPCILKMIVKTFSQALAQRDLRATGLCFSSLRLALLDIRIEACYLT